MHLTVLGCFGPYPPAGGACSGYLLEEGEYKILLDCGNGTLARLQQHCTLSDLQAVVLTHLHSDHISDLFVLRYALAAAAAQGKAPPPLPVFAPPQPAEEFGRLPYKDVFRVAPLKSGAELRLGPFRLTFQDTVHAAPCLAVRAEGPAGDVLVYSGDTEEFPELADFARGADLFLCDANFQEADMHRNPPNHLSAAQAGKVARAAGVKKLLLTHHLPGRDTAVSVKEAGAFFDRVEAAVEGRHY